MNIPTELKRALQEGKVIPFIGAGVSMSVKHRVSGERLFPSWKELLERAAAEIRKDDHYGANIVDSLVHKRRFIEAANEAERGLGNSRWPDFLREQFRKKREDADLGSLSLAHSIWRLGSNLVITTNYDNVLRWAHDRSDDVSEWKTTATAEQAQSIRELPNVPTVWHLHGHIDDISNIVLTEASYRRLYEPSANSESQHDAARETLKIHLAAKSFLFIGYSLDDYPFVEQLHYLQSLFGGYSAPHFVLLREGELERFKAKELKVTTIVYEDHGAPLLDLMDKLVLSTDGLEHTALEVGATAPEIAHGLLTTPVSVADFSPQKPAWNVPYPPKGQNVIGRKEALDRVRTQLVEGKRTAIGQTAAFQGLGGLGKTQMAVEYAWEYRDTYPAGVIWLNADQDMAPQLSAMAIKSAWVSPQSDSKTVYDIALRRIKTFENGLVIFDNLEERSAIQEYLLEPGVDAHILVTSRGEQPGFISVRIELLNPEQAETLLVQESGRLPQSATEREALLHVVEVLDGLPLALELAGAYMARRITISWVQYSVLLDESIQETFGLAAKLHDGGFTKHETDLFATLRLSEALIKDNPLLQEILRILAWSGTAAMGIDLLGAILGEGSDHMIREALGLGVSLSILKQEEGDRYAVHRLIRHVQREDYRLTDHKDWARERMVRLGDWFEAHRQEVMDLPAFEAEIDHLVTWFDQFGAQDQVQKARLLWLQAYPPYHRGQYEQSKAWLELARADLESSEYGNDELVAHILNDLGTIMNCLGRNLDAMSFTETALRLRRDVHGERHQDTAFSLANVGVCYGQLGKHDEAFVPLQSALRIQREVLGERHTDTALSIGHIGDLYLSIGDLNKALEYQEQALDIRQCVLGRRHPHTAKSLDSVGLIHDSLKNYDVAIKYKTEALEIKRQVLGNLHPSTAVSLHSVGATYALIGDHERSLDCHINALQIRASVLGELHPETAKSLLAIGACYQNAKDFLKALEFRKKGYEVRRAILGERHPESAEALNLVGVTHFSLRDLKESAKCALEAFEILAEVSGCNHTLTLQCVKNCVIAFACDGRGRSKGLPLLFRVLKELPRDHPAYKELKKLQDDIKSGGKVKFVAQ